MSLPSLAVRRPIATSMVLLAALLLGVVSWARLEVTLLPEIQPRRILVWIAYPDAGVLEIEESVARPVEESVVTARGVRDVRVNIVPGGLSATVILQPDTDPETAALSVREKLDAVRWRFPAEVERPVLLGTGGIEAPDLVLALSAADLAGAGEWARHVLRKRLEQIEGVARAQVVGEPRREIKVVPDPDAMASAGLGVRELATALEDANVPATGGLLRRRGVRYSLRLESALKSVEEIGAVVVGRTERRPIRLSDVARIEDGFADPQGWSRLDGHPAVGILVYREAGANLVDVAQRVRDQVAAVRDEFPAFRVETIVDPSPFVEQSIAGVRQAVWVGGILAFLVLVLFLREVRAPLFLVAALPVSVITSFAALDAFGVSLNLLSLGGLALGIGMLVDNSIICLENIHRHREDGHDPRTAAAHGAREVALPIMASTLTTCAVFLPLAWVPGEVGALFRDLAISVSASLVVSLFVALTMLPMLAARFPGRNQVGARPLFGVYHRWLGRWLRRPGLYLGLTAVVVAAATAVLAQLPREILPPLQTDTARVSLRLPPGTDVSATDQAALAVESWLTDRSEVERVFTSVGAVGVADPADPGRQESRADLRLQLTGAGMDRRAAFLAELAAAFAQRAHWNLEFVEDRTELAALFPRGEATLRVEVLGPDDQLAEDLVRRLAASVEASLTDDTLRLTVAETEPRVELVPRDDALWRLGLEEADVFAAVEARSSGLRATTLRRFQEEIPVVIRFDGSLPPDAGDIRTGGRAYPLRDLFETARMQAPAHVQRERQSRVSALRWDGELRDAGAVKSAVEASLRETPLPPGYVVRYAGSWREMQTTLRAVMRALALSAGLVLLVLAAQFESIRLPLLIFAAVPLALVGVAIALLLTGGTLNAFSAMGLMILVGIVVNDSILKVDLFARLTRQGVDPVEAVHTASRRRYRPILMTTLTTTLALVPLFFGAAGSFVGPLAATVIGGLTAATVLTLLAVPALFLLLTGARPAAEPVAEKLAS